MNTWQKVVLGVVILALVMTGTALALTTATPAPSSAQPIFNTAPNHVIPVPRIGCSVSPCDCGSC